MLVAVEHFEDTRIQKERIEIMSDEIKLDLLKPDVGAYVDTDTLIDEAIELNGCFRLVRELLYYHRWKSEDNPMVWRCSLAAPENFEVVGNTANEAIKRAIAKYKQIMQGESK